jgi:hypothetical protein
MAWSDHLEDPIMLPAGITLRTLSEAARYIQRLPATEAHKPHWQTACGILIDAAEGRDFVMHARIAMLRAVNHGHAAARAAAATQGGEGLQDHPLTKRPEAGNADFGPVSRPRVPDRSPVSAVAEQLARRFWCQAVMCFTAHMTASSIFVLASESSRLLPIPVMRS